MLKLKELRKKKKLTQADLAEVIGVSQVTMGRYETGEREMPYETLFQLADFFGVSIDEMLGRVPLDVVVNENPPTADPQEGMVRIVIPADVEPKPDDLERRIHEIVMKELEKRGL